MMNQTVWPLKLPLCKGRATISLFRSTSLVLWMVSLAGGRYPVVGPDDVVEPAARERSMPDTAAVWWDAARDPAIVRARTATKNRRLKLANRFIVPPFVGYDTADRRSSQVFEARARSHANWSPYSPLELQRAQAGSLLPSGGAGLLSLLPAVRKSAVCAERTLPFLSVERLHRTRQMAAKVL